MAAKTWDKDFRRDAIAASIRAMGTEHREDPFSFPGSFCIPMAERPVAGWTPGRICLVAMVLGMGLLVAGAMIASVGKNGVPRETWKIVLASVCSLSGIVMFFLPILCDRFVLSRIIGERGRRLLERSARSTSLVAELSNADRTKMKVSIDGDDHVLILFDEENRRLMMEGTGARYQVRGADVVQVANFQFMNYLGVDITCRIDPETCFRFAMARPSLLLELIRQAPLLFFLKPLIRNRLLGRTVSTIMAAPMDDLF